MNNSTIVSRAPAHVPRFVRFPRLYRPADDTWLLTDAVLDEIANSERTLTVLELCAGTGYIAVSAARAGADVTALDINPRAVTNTRFNAFLNRGRVTAAVADVRDLPSLTRFDLIVANPPYVPSAAEDPQTGAALAYNGGADGRALIDPVCERAADLLTPGGSLLLVQSEVNDVDRTCDLLRRTGVVPSVVTQRSIPFGPLMSARSAILESRGLIGSGQCTERISVIRGLLPAESDSGVDQLGTGATSDDFPVDQESSR